MADSAKLERRPRRRPEQLFLTPFAPCDGCAPGIQAPDDERRPRICSGTAGSNGRRLESIPEDIRPRTREEGYAVQALLEEHSAAPLFGWKIAATSKAGQANINVTGPLAGRLLAEKVADLSVPGQLRC